ncbi:YciI family protein [Roseateles cellulosilyticus]|uniref:YciI family protein n=1 Tax=Pelomonas cellulosilytica TaxID=2906762 RepID=A0ABS8XVZ8_9BURK|nr:YciI family protein [Pelomonas sp. P8]MCE4555890.1 YciI family protein [Pelomonas sp. P8]
MHYTIQIFETADGFAARNDPERQAAYWGGTMAYLQALKDGGVFVSGAGLQPPATATTLRRVKGELVLHDGPVADTKEMLGGYFVVDVPDLDAALKWAARFPDRPGIVVEVRPNLPRD